MKKYIILTLLALPLLFTTGCGIEIVDEGHTGVKKVLGDIKEETYSPGFYVVNPFTTNIIHMDNRVQKYIGESTVYTKDVQQANVSFTVNYYLTPTDSVSILSEVGRDYESKLIPQIVLGSIKNVAGKWNAIDLVSNREKATLEIQQSINEGFSKRGLGIDRFELTGLAYRPEFEKAVEDKVTAVQRAEEAQNNTVRIQEEANQQVITANAAAEAMRIKTEALKQSPILVSYEAVQKWDGKLPKMMLSNESVPFIQMPKY